MVPLAPNNDRPLCRAFSSRCTEGFALFVPCACVRCNDFTGPTRCEATTVVREWSTERASGVGTCGVDDTSGRDFRSRGGRVTIAVLVHRWRGSSKLQLVLYRPLNRSFCLSSYLSSHRTRELVDSLSLHAVLISYQSLVATRETGLTAFPPVVIDSPGNLRNQTKTRSSSNRYTIEPCTL